MATMTNASVVKSFLNGKESYNLNMRATADGRLFSYNTCIAQWHTDNFGNKTLIINRNKYSVTTSAKHQSPLFKEVERYYRYHYNVKSITEKHVPMGTQRLDKYIK